jgi:hypothetical protein
VNWLFGSIFWENGLETNSRWHLIKNFSSKSLFSQCCRLQARLKKMKCKNFPILQIFNLSKTQNFQKSLKIWVFIRYRDLRPKIKLLQFTQRITKKKLAGIGEPMVPDREMTGCFRKYLPFFNLIWSAKWVYGRTDSGQTTLIIISFNKYLKWFFLFILSFSLSLRFWEFNLYFVCGLLYALALWLAEISSPRNCR